MNLHSIVKPGETLVYATEGESFAEPFVALLGLMAGGSVLMALIQPGGVWTIVGFFLLLVAVVTFASRKEQQISQAQVVITDRRLLFHTAGKSATVIDVPLSSVSDISWSETGRTGMLHLATDDGMQTVPAMREPDALAHALAKASGKPSPPAIGRMLNADLLVPGSYLVTAGTLYLLLRWVLEERWVVTLGDTTMWEGIAVEVFSFVSSIIASVVLAVPVGRFIGVMLTVTLMKPCVTAEEMRVGLNARNPERWHRRAALRWAAILYGSQWMPSSARSAGQASQETAPST